MKADGGFSPVSAMMDPRAAAAFMPAQECNLPSLFFLVFRKLPVCFIVFWKDEWRERSDGDVIRSVVAFWNRMQEDMNRFYKPPGWRRDCHLTLIKTERCSTAFLFLFSIFLCLSFLLPPADSVAFHTLPPFYFLPLSALSLPSVSLVTLFFWLLVFHPSGAVFLCLFLIFVQPNILCWTLPLVSSVLPIYLAPSLPSP